jgi:hypothetical protein
VLHIEGHYVYRFPREHWRQQREEGPVGGMTGGGVHVVDSMLYLAGPIESVVAQSARLVLDCGLETRPRCCSGSRAGERLPRHRDRDRRGLGDAGAPLEALGPGRLDPASPHVVAHDLHGERAGVFAIG